MRLLITGLLMGLFTFGLHAQKVKFNWAKSSGGDGFDSGHSIAIDVFFNVYVVGTYDETVDFDPGPTTFNLTSHGTKDIFIQKLDSAGNFLWAKTIGAFGLDNGRSITTDALGNVYVTGEFQGTVDFDPGPGTFNLTAFGNSDVFILKLDSAGNFIWAISMEGSDHSTGQSIVLDGSGNIYITGYFESVVDFDPGPAAFNLTAAGESDIYVQKFDRDGNFIWAKSMGAQYNDYGFSIKTDDLENVYVTGVFKNTVDFDPNGGVFELTSNGRYDIFVQKLDGNGNFLWAVSLGAWHSDEDNSLVIDASRNVYITGSYVGKVDFDPGLDTFNLTSAGFYDFFILKLDTDGNFLWVRSTGGETSERVNAIALDAQGDVYVAGRFDGTVDFDPGPNTFNLTSVTSFRDIFIQKLDDNGDFIWAKLIGGPVYTKCCSMTSDVKGNFYATGFYSGTTDFNPGSSTFNLTSNGSTDYFVLKLGDELCALQADFAADAVCLGESTEFQNLTTDPSPYLLNNWHWDFGDVHTSNEENPSHVYDQPGDYSVTLTAVNDSISKCIATKTKVVQVMTPPEADLGMDIDMCDGGQRVLHIEEGQGVYLWDDSSQSNTRVVEGEGKFWVDVRNQCGEVSDTLTVSTSLCHCKLYYPNAFTPNGDTHNDFFEVKSICEIVDFEIIIFNRWGQKVFQSQDHDFKWFGQMSSDDGMQIDIYSFKIKGTLLHEDGRQIDFDEMSSVRLLR